MLFALTIFVSAFLLFLVQPIVGKQILPWFGGSAAVWSTCLVFFQFALLAGYFYSDWMTRKLTLRRQAVVHVALLVAAVSLLPIVPSPDLKPTGAEEPSLRILLLLAVTIGLPYFLLSATSPLVQAWFTKTHPDSSPYRLFALSNLASMVALLGYPLLIEPTIATRNQAIYWSVGFGVFAVLIAMTLWRARNAAALVIATTPIAAPAPAPTTMEKLVWIALAGVGSSLLLGVTNHLTQNISSIPLLWVIPLAVYLLTFILCFNNSERTPRWYPRFVSLPLTALVICAMAWLLVDKKLEFKLLLHVATFVIGLFLACMYCHGELVARKPAPQHLTAFYLAISIGGAMGSFAIGIVAPLTLPAYYEFGFSLYALAALATWLLRRQLHWSWVSTGAAVSLFALSTSIYGIQQTRKDTVAMSRNFYGALRVKEYDSADENSKRWLVHGAILHGDQYLDPIIRRTPTTYYKRTSGVGMALERKEKDLGRPKRVGVIGLGAGTLAAYGRKGDVFRFYDINPGVVQIAQREFTYLQDSEADIEIALGDARLNLEREAAQRFDVLAIDAFSSDSIPVHLITLEALAVYEKHMQSDGIIAFHVSNRFLHLQPVVEKLALARGLNVAWIEEVRDDGTTDSDWILLCKDRQVLLQSDLVAATQPIPSKPHWRIWTDDFNNLVQVLK